MLTTKTAGDLRRQLQGAGEKWVLDPRFQDSAELPRFALGGDLTKVPKVADVPRIDIAPYLSAISANPFVMRRRIERGFIDAATLSPFVRVAPAAAGAVAAVAAGGGAPPASVDWRNRYGWPWLTNIKDQGQCESCWVFSAVGVVEAMTRIEHCVWSLRSEGDVHDGLGASCAQTGDPATALNWIQGHGVADPGCWAYEQQNLPYAPTADRPGRTVKLDGYVTLNTIQDQKNWLDAVGPITACFEVYQDFWYGTDVSGVYTQQSTIAEGGHCVVIVGYDDTKQAWLMRNSWGTGWGVGGYCWFGYGQCGIDGNVKYGVPLANTNPDPWTKRHIHNGAIYESGDGARHHNFEVWTKAPGNAVRHYWRDGVSLNWALAETFGNDCASVPSAQGTTFNRNFEMVFRTTANRLHHWYFDQSQGKYFDGGVFGPTNVAGDPGFIQGDYGAPGNFELVVMLAGGQLAHWWRPNTPIGAWVQSAVFGANVAHSGAALVQRPDNGLDVVVANSDGTMQRYFRNDHAGLGWSAQEKFGANVHSAPVMVQGEFGASNEAVQGNYELCVAAGGQIQHWWKSNQPAGNWSMSAQFGTNVAGASVTQVLGLIESSYGFDLEIIVLLSNGGLQHFWRDGNGWHPGPVFGSTTV